MPKRFQQRGRNHRQHLFDQTTDSAGNSAGVVTGQLVFDATVADTATVTIDTIENFDCAEWVLVITNSSSEAYKATIAAFKKFSSVFHNFKDVFYISGKIKSTVSSSVGVGDSIVLQIENTDGQDFDVKLYRILTI